MTKILKRFGIPVLALFVAFSLLAAAGCKKSGGERAMEKMIEKASGGKAEVDASGGSLKIKTAEGEAQIGTITEWPSDLPADLPKLEGRVQSAIKMNVAGGASWIIGLGGVDEAAVTDYIQKLKDAGWIEAFSSSADTVMMVHLTKAEVTVGLTFDKAKGDLSLSITVEKQN